MTLMSNAPDTLILLLVRPTWLSLVQKVGDVTRANRPTSSLFRPVTVSRLKASIFFSRRSLSTLSLQATSNLLLSFDMARNSLTVIAMTRPRPRSEKAGKSSSLLSPRLVSIHLVKADLSEPTSVTVSGGVERMSALLDLSECPGASKLSTLSWLALHSSATILRICPVCACVKAKIACPSGWLMWVISLKNDWWSLYC